MLQFVHAAQAQVGTLENDYATVFPWVQFGIACAVVGLGLVIFFIIRRRSAKPSTEKLVCLMVTLPKEQQEEDSGKGPSRIQQMQEQISVGESFFSFLGNMRAQRWYHTLGRGAERPLQFRNRCRP